ncbi:BREX-1 system adenine-specific DNA-methyltransferase PglX [Aeromonas hydrophila]
MSQQENNKMQQHFYRASAADFGKIPGSPVAYWVDKKTASIFSENQSFENIGKTRRGLQTGEAPRFVRNWHEVDISNIGFGLDKQTAEKSGRKWFPFNSGGAFRKWYGNIQEVVNWKNDGQEIKGTGNAIIPSESLYFKQAITWPKVSSGVCNFRWFPDGVIPGDAGPCYFDESNLMETVLCFSNSKVALSFLEFLSPTLNFEVGVMAKMPIVIPCGEIQKSVFQEAIFNHRYDWDSFEGSFDFTKAPILKRVDNNLSVENSYQKLRKSWLETTLEMQRLEEENNRLFIEAYGLQDELTPEVPLSEITLTCNPHYRYGGNLTDEEREARLQSDTICELISYAIGCMMGRYSLDREGLVYAHAGNESFKALVEEGAYATFAADEDGILPLSTDSWFEDDVATRLEAFVCTVWGKETLEENLQFIADSLCLAAIKSVKKGGETSRETLRRYLSTQFYKDHLKTYKKRPIYWLFSSGKEKAFECLVYLHRYNEATLPRMRTEYVTPLLGQMAGRIERLRLQQAEAGTAEAKRIGKDIDSLTKQLTELRAFDDELKHHADMRIRLDLDDGVKVNYGKFGTLLSDVKAITGDKGE